MAADGASRWGGWWVTLVCDAHRARAWTVEAVAVPRLAGRDLEVLADPVPVDVRSRRRPAAVSRWAAAATVLVVAVGLWLVFPARSALSRS